MEAVRFAASTRSRDEAAALLQRSFPDLQLRVPAAEPGFAMRHTAVGGAGVRSHELAVTGDVVIDGPLPSGVIATGFLLGGRAAIECGGRRIDTTRPYLQPTAQGTVRANDPNLRLITFDVTTFREAADRYREVIGGRLRLTRSSPRSPEAAAAWRWGADRLHEALRDGTALDNPIIMGELFDGCVRLVLTAFGELVDRAPLTPQIASPAAVRRAVAYLEEHAGRPITMPEVATAAHVSLRSLQAQFQRYLGVTPLEHLHHIRLDAARRELLEGDGDESSVHDVAHRWGFGNSGRFAKQYADRFGERPSESRRRRD